MSDWAEAFEQRSVDNLLEQLQEDLREMWDRGGNPHILGLSVIADQLGKKLNEERGSRLLSELTKLGSSGYLMTLPEEEEKT